jgi:hypothetical protein
MRSSQNFAGIGLRAPGAIPLSSFLIDASFSRPSHRYPAATDPSTHRRPPAPCSAFPSLFNVVTF